MWIIQGLVAPIFNIGVTILGAVDNFNFYFYQ